MASTTEVFEDLPTAEEVDADIHIASGGDGLYTIALPDRTIGPSALSTGIMTLVTAITRLALDADPHRLHLHAAGVANGNTGVVISATSGTGKTTLTAELARRGWNYLSDEALVLDGSQTALEGFTKPMSVKPSGRDVVAGVADARVDLGEGDADWWHVPAGRLGAGVVDEIEPHMVVVLEPASTYEQPAVVRPIHPADAVVRLMGETMDPERYGPRTLNALADLAARCRCVTMAVGTLESQVAALEASLTEQRPRHVVDSLDTEHCVAIEGWTLGTDIRSLAIAGRVVVHNATTGAIAALDEAGTAVWMALHGTRENWLSDEMLREVGDGFLTALSQVGFVKRAGDE